MNSAEIQSPNQFLSAMFKLLLVLGFAFITTSAVLAQGTASIRPIESSEMPQGCKEVFITWPGASTFVPHKEWLSAFHQQYPEKIESVRFEATIQRLIIRFREDRIGAEDILQILQSAGIDHASFHLHDRRYYLNLDNRITSDPLKHD